MIPIVTALHVLVCLVLIVVILIQGGRGQGLTGPSFASGNVQSLLGTRAADFITKATTFSAICFLFTCIALNYFEAQKSRSLLEIPRHRAPVDVETIKKALEKIKAEKPSVATPGAPIPEAKKPVATNTTEKPASPKPAVVAPGAPKK